MPGQGNNAYIFPGIALGVIATGTHHIPDDMFLIASQILSEHVSDDDLRKGSLYPPLNLIKEVSIQIAIAVTKYAYSKGELHDLLLLIEQKLTIKNMNVCTTITKQHNCIKVQNVSN